MTEYRSLIGRLTRTLDDLATLVVRVETLIEKAQRYDEEAYLHAAALDLHGFYTGAEQAFEAIARTVDGSVPRDPGWHRELLLRMATEVPDVRPAVLSTGTESRLDAYRGFRHVVRNAYTINLNPERVRDLGAGARECLAQLSSDFTRFIVFLDALDPPS